jgi:hypothetical protein
LEFVVLEFVVPAASRVAASRVAGLPEAAYLQAGVLTRMNSHYGSEVAVNLLEGDRSDQ